MVATGDAQVGAVPMEPVDVDPAGRDRVTPVMRPLVGGSGADFDDFYRREHQRVLKHALWLVRDLGAAEDLTQEAFVAAHRSWARVGDLEWPAGWVQRVVSNRAVSRYRRLVRDGRLVRALTRRPPASVPVAEDRADLWDAVRRLPARQAQAVALVYGAGYTVADAASVLGCGPETVKTHLARGRAALATALATDEGREPDCDEGGAS
jgi:RNA polymerase sigma-70 factor, ECF subfamily